MTWKEIRDAALQLMFTYSIGGRVNDSEANSDFLLAMYAPANYALNDLANIQPVVRSVVLKQYPEPNVATVEDGVVEGRARSFYADVDGQATVYFEQIQEDGSVVVEEIREINHKTFSPVKFTYPTLVNARVRIMGDARVKDIALYAGVNELSPADVQTYSIKALGIPFIRLADKPVRLNEVDISGNVKYDGVDKLVIPSEYEGEIHVYYNAYPGKIDADTPDDYDVGLSEEAAALIPYFIASVVYAEDDIQLSKDYQNRYNEGKLQLRRERPFRADEFISISGWY